MAHILEFSVDGLAGRKEEYARELNREVNVFFGSNGSGKTSLFKILHSAMSGDSAILNNVPFKKAKVTLFSLDYKKNFSRSITQQNVATVSGAQPPSQTHLFGTLEAVPKPPSRRLLGPQCRRNRGQARGATGISQSRGCIAVWCPEAV
jgi:energy-coupling factor transporter ATP-binding protein EcfA2